MPAESSPQHMCSRLAVSYRYDIMDFDASFEDSRSEVLKRDPEEI